MRSGFHKEPPLFPFLLNQDRSVSFSGHVGARRDLMNTGSWNKSGNSIDTPLSLSLVHLYGVDIMEE